AVMKLTPQKVEEISGEFSQCWPVNYNSPAQTVVAMNKSNLESFCAQVKSQKGRAVPLSVSGAFHSPYMEEASEKLFEYMDNLSFSAPKIPVFANYNALPYSGNFKSLLKMQVMNPVKWQTTIENLINEGVDTFIEVGVGKTLMGLIKKINPDVKVFKVENTEDLSSLDI
ncbi:MAG: ACP S-malonyltransferase, partial [Acutalibacteraceae bacterium]